MPELLSLVSATPAHSVASQELSEYLSASTRGVLRFVRMVGATRIKRRYFALPIQRLIALRGHTQRQAEYTRAALALCEATAREALRLAGVGGSEVDAVVPVSCTGYLMPSLDAHLINRLELSASARRVPITQLGCSAGAAAIGLAAELLRGCGKVLVLSVELCSLCMEQEEPSSSDLLGRLLFADGAAAAVLSADELHAGPEVVASGSVLIPGSLDALRTRLSDFGFRLGLSPALPQLIGDHLRAATEAFLAKSSLTLGQVDFFAVHPGGPKILDACRGALDLDDAALSPSWDVLESFGNTSSAAIFFVLQRLEESHHPAPGSLALAVAFGPGVTCEFLLLRWRTLATTRIASVGASEHQSPASPTSPLGVLVGENS